MMDIGAWGCCRGRQRLEVEEDVTPSLLCNGRVSCDEPAGVHDGRASRTRASHMEMQHFCEFRVTKGLTSCDTCERLGN